MAELHETLKLTTGVPVVMAVRWLDKLKGFNAGDPVEPMTLGRTSLITETGAEPLSAAGLDFLAE